LSHCGKTKSRRGYPTSGAWQARQPREARCQLLGQNAVWRCRRGCAIYIYIHTCMHIHIHIHVYIIERERDRQIYRDREMICGLTLAPARQPREARCQLLGQNAVVVMPARVRSPFMCIERERGRYIYNMSIVCGCVWM